MEFKIGMHTFAVGHYPIHSDNDTDDNNPLLHEAHSPPKGFIIKTLWFRYLFALGEIKGRKVIVGGLDFVHMKRCYYS